MKLKNTVRLKDLKTQLVVAMMVVDRIYEDDGQELVVTSVNDSVHGTGSLHYSGNAFDARTNIFSEIEKDRVFKEIKEQLDADFDIVNEADHYHIEYDPK